MNASTFAHSLSPVSYSVPAKNNDFLIFFPVSHGGQKVELDVANKIVLLNVSVPLHTNVSLTNVFMIISLSVYNKKYKFRYAAKTLETYILFTRH